MLKKFGYTNIALLVMGVIIMFVYVDIKNPGIADYIIITLFTIVIIIHVIRVFLIFIIKRNKN